MDRELLSWHFLEMFLTGNAPIRAELIILYDQAM
jgi:hypothetical protein